MHYWTRIMQFLQKCMQTFYPVHIESPKVANNSLGGLRNLIRLDWSRSYTFSISLLVFNFLITCRIYTEVSNRYFINSVATGIC